MRTASAKTRGARAVCMQWTGGKSEGVAGLRARVLKGDQTGKNQGDTVGEAWDATRAGAPGRSGWPTHARRFKSCHIYRCAN